MSKPIKLLRHPGTPSDIPTPWVRVERSGEVLRLTFRIPGDTSAILFPDRLEPVAKQSAHRRMDRLWEHTCFELFIRPSQGPAYVEWNFSPSSEWAAFKFDGYRTGMRDADVSVPAVIPTAWDNRFELSASLQLPEWKESTWFLNAAAVIEEKSGRKSYWALAHRPGPPDFHHSDCFALELPPAA